MMAKAELEQLMRRQVDAYNRRDLEEFCVCFHAEVSMKTLISGDSQIRGLEQLRLIFKMLFEAHLDLHCEIQHRVILEDAVIDEEWVTGLTKYPTGLHTVVIYGFREGKIDRMWTCT